MQAMGKPSGTPTRLSAFLATGSRGENVDLPGLGPAWIELAGHETVNRIESETFEAMARLALEPNALNGLTYDAERARRTLAAVVREQENHEKCFGTVEEWGRLDSDMIAAAWNVYADVRYRLDPVGDDSLTKEDDEGIRAFLEKKSAMGLRSYGVAKLARYMLTSEDRRATSQTLSSSSSQSSEDSSTET
jgi:hypothetical protein